MKVSFFADIVASAINCPLAACGKLGNPARKHNIIVFTYCSKWHRSSLSHVAVNGITLMARPCRLMLGEDMWVNNTPVADVKRAVERDLVVSGVHDEEALPIEASRGVSSNVSLRPKILTPRCSSPIDKNLR